MFHVSSLTDITVFHDIGVGKARQILNVSEIAIDLGPAWCETLLGFYVFTGEDCNAIVLLKGKAKCVH